MDNERTYIPVVPFQCVPFRPHGLGSEGFVDRGHNDGLIRACS